MDLQKPRFLYKYCSAERALQILSDRYLYLCPPKDLNDLYEGSIGRMLRYSPEVGFELKWRQIRAHTGWNEEESRSFVREHEDEAEIKTNFDYTANSLRQLNALAREHSGITCLSERRGDQRMWGTYGDNHQGACIEFVNHGPSSLIQRHCLPVRYDNERLDSQLPELMTEKGHLDIGLFAMFFYFQKSLDWKSEREWGILMLANDHQSPASRRMPFDHTDIKRIFIGPRMAQEHEKKLYALASSISLDWGIFKLRPDSDQGVTNFEGVDVVKSFDDLKYWLPALRSGSDEA